MKRSLMEQLKSPIWIILGIGLVVIAGLLLVVALLNPEAASLAPEGASAPSSIASGTSTTAKPDTSTVEPRPTSEPPAAVVNGYTITQSYLNQTVRLNTVLGELSGADTLDKRETLDRLIRSQLILQGVTAIDEPTQEDVDAFITGLEQNWGVSDETVNEKLQAAGLERAFLDNTIKRLLTVEAGVENLENEGHDILDWLQEQEEDADIQVLEDLVSAEDVEPTAQPTDQMQPTASPERRQPEVVDVAPSFTLDQAGGGVFTLEDQLEEGPVVLVFFEKCG